MACVENAYANSFSKKEITPVKKVDDIYVLELFHGPTCAFKMCIRDRNSSDELLFVVAKVEHSKWYDGSDLSKKYGFSGDKKSLWKSAVFSMYEINSHIVFKDVKAYSRCV